MIFFKYKRIKYFILQTKSYIYLKNLFKIFFIKKNFKILFSEIKIGFLGNFKTKIRLNNFDETSILFNDIDYIQGLRYFTSKSTKVYIYSSSSNLIYNFFSRTLNCKTIICKENFIQNYKKNKNLKIVNKKIFFKKIKKTNSFNSNIFVSENLDINNCSNLLLKFKYIFLKNKSEYLSKKLNNYIYDFFGKINKKEINFYKKYYLYSNEKLIPSKRKKVLISGIACLKNLDLYPFDICFESALKVVDELIIGIDTDTFNSKYKKILNKFLKQTKYRNKIKLKFFSFNSSTTNFCRVRGRWIADVFNKLSNECINENVMICGADELFEINLRKKLSKNILNNYDEIKFYFYHFVYNFKFIRDPKFAAYNTWHRIVNINNYVSNRDGMGFRKSDYFYPKKILLDAIVFHIGYIINYNKKIDIHLNKRSGVFGNLYSKKKYISLIRPIPIKKDLRKRLKNTIKKLNYLDSYKKIKKLI